MRTDKAKADAYEELLLQHRQRDPITVTQPTMPRIEDYTRALEGVWERRWLTNDGQLHRELEKRLCEYLRVNHLSLFCNGTIALLVALQALRIDDGEVITTPFTFPATTHVLHWNRITPVFCDIEAQTFNVDPDRVERLISPRTRAILAVHVYGNPCALNALQAIADRHGLKLIYDAAHAFGVEVEGKPILEYGDVSMLSFHATKVFSTIEGGALISKTAAERTRITSLKNFGIADEETVIGPGINGKMNEFQAAFGLLHLASVDQEIERRRSIAEHYRAKLAGVPRIRTIGDIQHVRHNYGYFPITVSQSEYGISRDRLHAALRDFNILSRKYFYPLVSHASCYSGLPSAAPESLPVAERAASEVLCLPIYGALPLSAVETICDIVRALPDVVA